MTPRVRIELYAALVFMIMARAHPWPMNTAAVFALGLGLAVEPMIQLSISLRRSLLSSAKG